jgi:SAM-dependent methyltransferase
LSLPWYEEHFRADYFRFWLGGEATPALPPEQTELEVAFIKDVLALPSGSAILDLCCGHGRHAIPLALAGYRVVGLDLSRLHLQVARRMARATGAKVQWLQRDMRLIPDRLTGRFDAVINMFISFGYLESDAEDQRALAGVARVLKPGGRFLIDSVNRQFALRHLQSTDSVELNGTVLVFNQAFDPLTNRTSEERIAIEPDGTRHVSRISMRYYSAAELVDLMEGVGLRTVSVWGGFDRSELSSESQRMILLAEKVA